MVCLVFILSVEKISYKNCVELLTAMEIDSYFF